MRAPLAGLAPLAVLLVGCLSVPAGMSVHVSEHGCLPTGGCPFGGRAPANFYWPPDQTVVLAPAVGPLTAMHEVCHAHQHERIIAAGLEASVDLHEWYSTAEGGSFVQTFASKPHPWAWLSSETALEDFAYTCALYIVDPDQLASRDAAHAARAAEWLR